MMYLLLAILFFIAVYFSYRLFSLKKAIKKAAGELSDISEDLEQNRVLKLRTPDSDLEKLLESINRNLIAIRRESLNYAKKERQLREQIENISHDLRTPLTSILGYLKMLDTANMSAEDLEYLDIALRKSHTLQNLVSQFYELSRITSQDFHLQLVPVDAARILKETCLDHYGLFEKQQLDISMDIPDTSAVILGDDESLKRIFSNLLQNTVRYARSELHVQMIKQQDNKQVEFLFTNDIFPEIEAEDPSRLFDRFYMQEESRGRGGTGLGLTISKNLVEHMNGTIEASYSDKGEKRVLTFIIHFSL